MTIASDLGFEIGGWYEVVYCDAWLKHNDIKVGDYVQFVEDDGGYCPWFRTTDGREFCAYIKVHDNIPIKVIPKKKPLTLNDLKVGSIIMTKAVDDVAYNYIIIEGGRVVNTVTGGVSRIEGFKSNHINSSLMGMIIAKVTYGDTVLYKRELLFKEDLKIKELEDTINKASKQLEELKKLKATCHD